MNNYFCNGRSGVVNHRNAVKTGSIQPRNYRTYHVAAPRQHEITIVLFARKSKAHSLYFILSFHFLFIWKVEEYVFLENAPSKRLESKQRIRTKTTYTFFDSFCYVWPLRRLPFFSSSLTKCAQFIFSISFLFFLYLESRRIRFSWEYETFKRLELKTT